MFDPDDSGDGSGQAPVPPPTKKSGGFNYAKALEVYNGPAYEKLSVGTQNTLEQLILDFEQANKIAGGAVWDGYDSDGEEVETRPYSPNKPSSQARASGYASAEDDPLTLNDRVKRRGGNVLQEKGTALETASEFARQGFSSGFSDELEDSAGEPLMRAEGRGGDAPAALDESASARKDRLASQHPNIALASELGAGLASSAVGGPILKLAGKAVPPLARLGGRVSQMLTHADKPIRSGIAKGAASSVPGSVVEGAGHADGGTAGERLQAGIETVPYALGGGALLGGMSGTASSIRQGTRNRSNLGPALQNVEAAGGKTSFTQGVTAPPGIDTRPRSIGDRIVPADRAAASEAADIVAREGADVQRRIIQDADEALEAANPSGKFVPSETYKRIDDALENGDLDADEAGIYRELAERLTKLTDDAPTDRVFREATPQNLDRLGMAPDTMPPPAAATAAGDTVRPPGRRRAPAAAEAVPETSPSSPARRRVGARAGAEATAPQKPRYMTPKSMYPEEFDDAVSRFEGDVAQRSRRTDIARDKRPVRDGGQPVGSSRGRGSSEVAEGISADRARMREPSNIGERAAQDVDRLQRGRRGAGLAENDVFDGTPSQRVKIEKNLLKHGDRPGDADLRALFKDRPEALKALHRIPLTRETLALQNMTPGGAIQFLNPASQSMRDFSRLRLDPVLGQLTGDRGLKMTPSIRGTVSSIIGANEGRKRRKEDKKK